MAANQERSNAKPPLRPGCVESDGRPLTSSLYPATDFIVSPSHRTADASPTLPISTEGLTSMREKMLVHDKFFMKYIGSSKNTVAMKSSLQDLFIAYQTAFNTLISGYAQVANLLTSTESCRPSLRPALASPALASQPSMMPPPGLPKHSPHRRPFRRLSSPTPGSEFRTAPQWLSGPSTTFIIASTPAASSKFADFASTKSVLYKAVNPIDFGLKVKRVTRAGESEVRVEAESVNLEKLRSSEVLTRAGLLVREDYKFNPRLLVLGIPRDMTKEEIRRDLIHQNLDGEEDLDIKVVYMYTPNGDSPVTKCVVEVPPNVRAKLRFPPLGFILAFLLAQLRTTSG